MMPSRLPKITVKMNDLVTVGNAKIVKSWMKETKPQLEEYARRMLDKVEKEEAISWWDVYELEATYFDSYELPVITIIGSAYDTSDQRGKMFLEAYASDEGRSAVNRFTREQ